jgi:HEAT repeat protein
MDALELLAEKGGDAALDPVREALKDPDPEVRGLAQGLMEEQRALALTRLEQLKVKNP